MIRTADDARKQAAIARDAALDEPDPDKAYWQYRRAQRLEQLAVALDAAKKKGLVK